MFSVIQLRKIPSQYELINSANDYCHLYQHKTKLNKFIGSTEVPALYGNKKFYFLLTGITREYMDSLLFEGKGLSLEEYDIFEDICFNRSIIISQLKTSEAQLRKTDPGLYSMKPGMLVLPLWASAFMSAMKEHQDIQTVIYAICQTIYSEFVKALNFY